MQRKSLLGWWIKVRRRLPVAAVCVAVGVLLIAETALGQRTQRRVIPACTSPEFAPRITPSPVKVPVGGKRTVTTAMLCDIESLFLSSAEALAIWLVDGDTLSKTTSTAGSDRLGLLMSSRGTDVPVPADQLEPLFNAIKRELTCPKEDPKIFGLTARGNFSGDLDSR